jgi:hypothetical protein
LQDTSLDAFTPTLGFATKVISVCVLLFFALIAFVFWLASLHDKKDYAAATTDERTSRGHGPKVSAAS